MRNKKTKGTKADLRSIYTASEYHKFIKKEKHRIERRRAKQNPECLPCYGKYDGWES